MPEYPYPAGSTWSREEAVLDRWTVADTGLTGGEGGVRQQAGLRDVMREDGGCRWLYETVTCRSVDYSEEGDRSACARLSLKLSVAGAVVPVNGQAHDVQP